MSVINRLDGRGHGPVARWSAEHADQVVSAKQVFDKMLEDGYLMTDVSDPKEEVVLKAFDPNATEILAVPRMIGG